MPFTCRVQSWCAAIAIVAMLCTSIQAGDEDVARHLIRRANMDRGLCAVVGDGGHAIELVKQSGLLVHVRTAKSNAANALRARAQREGLTIQRLVAEHGKLNPLPYATNTVDVLLLDADRLKQVVIGEVMRVLRPEGVALVGRSNPEVKTIEFVKQIGDWAKSVPVKDVEGSKEAGMWARIVKPPQKGADEWSHWEKSPDNNPVSTDSIIKAPYMTQFMATPYYIGMPAITTAAGGRTFLAIGHIAHHQREWNMLNRLIARNGYNGTVLWERKLPEGYLVHRSAFVATRDTFYMIDGESCLLLDAKTGKEEGAIKIAGADGAWKWMAMQDGVLYVLAGKPGPGAKTTKGDRAFGGWSWGDLSKGYYGKHPHGFGDTVAAYDIANKKTLWTHKEDSLIDSRGLAIRDTRFFLYCPDKHLRCLSRSTGKEIWTNKDSKTLGLIEEPGKGLRSTPGWRTQTLVVATPQALIIQGQTRMNVVAVSADDGYLLWQKKKITNNPNAIYIDGKIVLGVGPGGMHQVIDPVTGKVEEDLRFYKRACTRLTASTDSLFCRGEGMTRFDRTAKKLMIDGTVRPACNDGVIPAHGLLYLGPWACDCNLSLIGNVARCSAGDFRFDVKASDQLQKSGGTGEIKAFDVTTNDWSTYRGNNARSSGTQVPIAKWNTFQWHHKPEKSRTPTAPTAANGLIFFGGDDGIVRALDAKNGAPRWQFATAGVVKYPPTIANGRAIFGSGDGHAYCLEAATGRLLWRFRAAPLERHIMVYGNVSSTWPVNTGVLVHDGVAYFAAGIVDHDGTYVCALDVKTGQPKWQNNSSGHLNKQLRKGISAQGNLALYQDKFLMLAGGNQISPAAFDLKTGKCLEQPRQQGQPQSNAGRFMGVFNNDAIIAGGRILYSSPRNVSTKGSFAAWSAKRRTQSLAFGGIAPSWNDKTFVVVNFKYGRITAFDTAKMAERIDKGVTKGPSDRRGGNRFANNIVASMTAQKQVRWQSNQGDSNRFEAVSMAVCPNVIVAVAKYQQIHRTKPQWFVAALSHQNGGQMFEQELPGVPLPDGLLIDRNGRIIVTLIDGGLVCYSNNARR